MLLDTAVGGAILIVPGTEKFSNQQVATSHIVSCHKHGPFDRPVCVWNGRMLDTAEKHRALHCEWRSIS
jgi:hypothetical protein